MEANLHAIIIIYILILTGFFIFKYAEKPKFNIILLKYFIINVIVLSLYLWFLRLYMFTSELDFPPLGQVILPFLCYLFFYLFIPKYYEYAFKLLALTIFTTFVLSFHFFALTYDSSITGYTNGISGLSEIDEIIKERYRGQEMVMGAGTFYPPLYRHKIDGEYPANWLFDSEIIYKIYDEDIKDRKKSDMSLKISFEDYKNLCRINKIQVKPLWHTFFSGIYYCQKQNYEFWHKGGKVTKNNFELKIRD